MAIEWTPELATGSDEIDVQHKMIFAKINEMLEACNRGKGRENVEKMLLFLEEYVHTHFRLEERFMRDKGYPDYEAHRALHLGFIEQLSGIRKDLEREGTGVQTVIAVNQLVVQWFINHIKKVDARLGAFSRTIG